MSRAVTTEETKKLFEFCREQNVEHYDLQVELVDHLASSIEEQWETNPELAFENALYKSFWKFGNQGFREIYKVKKKELNNKYTKLHFQFFYRFFRWPRILLTFVLTYLLFQTIILTGNLRSVYFMFFGFALISIAFFYLFWFPRKLKVEVKNDTKFLLLEILNMRYKTFVLVLFMPLNLLNVVALDIFPKSEWRTMSYEEPRNQLIILILSFLMVCFGILFYGFAIYASQKIRTHFLQQFPEFEK